MNKVTCIIKNILEPLRYEFYVMLQGTTRFRSGELNNFSGEPLIFIQQNCTRCSIKLYYFLIWDILSFVRGTIAF